MNILHGKLRVRAVCETVPTRCCIFHWKGLKMSLMDVRKPARLAKTVVRELAEFDVEFMQRC